MSRRGRSSGNHNVTQSFTRRQSGRPTRSQCTFTFDYLTLWTVAGRGSEQPGLRRARALTTDKVELTPRR